MQRTTTTAIGRGLERLARIAAPVLALAITAALLLAELAFELGRQTGAAIHARSEQLGRLHVALLGLAPAPAQPQGEAQPRLGAKRQEPAAPAPVPAAAHAFEELTVPQLRTLARQQLGSSARINGRRIAQARRAELVLALA
jgi:hypothetical protein